jgi:hypothetical protein
MLDAYVDSVKDVLAHYDDEVKLADESITADYQSGRITMIIGALIAILLGATYRLAFTSEASPVHCVRHCRLRNRLRTVI